MKLQNILVIVALAVVVIAGQSVCAKGGPGYMLLIIGDKTYKIPSPSKPPQQQQAQPEEEQDGVGEFLANTRAKAVEMFASVRDVLSNAVGSCMFPVDPEDVHLKIE